MEGRVGAHERAREGCPSGHAPAGGDGATRPVDLVCEGGGVRGIALVGAFAALEGAGYRPHNVAGTSAGAIVATLIAAGYRASELRAIIAALDFRRFCRPTPADRLPLVGKGLSVLLQQGVYEGDFVVRWLRDLLAPRGIRTFGDLVGNPAAQDLRYRYRLQVVASDVTMHRLLVLPRDAASLGVVPDALDVALAVRMSMSIPLFFTPVRLRNAATGREHLIVDGGLLSNFPIWLFDVPDEPRWPTFGLRLVAPGEASSDLPAAAPPPSAPPPWHVGEGMEAGRYLRGLVETMLEAHDRRYIEDEGYSRTIAIPTLGVRTTDFGLSPAQAQALYEAGHAAARRFLDAWDFAAYIAAFRRGRRLSRRAALAEQMRLAALRPA